MEPTQVGGQGAGEVAHADLPPGAQMGVGAWVGRSKWGASRRRMDKQKTPSLCHPLSLNLSVVGAGWGLMTSALLMERGGNSNQRGRKGCWEGQFVLCIYESISPLFVYSVL